MYAGPFEYLRASSWDEAVRLLLEGGDEARAIAGGQSLVPMMTLRLATPRLLVDIGSVDEPSIARKDDTLTISALTRHTDLERAPVIAAACPLLAEAASLVGNVRVRHRGTIGGTLAHADPSAELSAAVVALEGAVHTLGPGGERRISSRDFFKGYFTSALEPAEVVTGVEVPVVEPGTGSAFLELVRRAGDFAIVGVAALVKLDGPTCARAQVVLCGVGDGPVDVSDVVALASEPFDERAAVEAGRRSAAAVEPSGSPHASAGYRREMVAVFVRRALLLAAERARAADGERR